MNIIPHGAQVSPLSVCDADSLVYNFNGKIFRLVSSNFYSLFWARDQGRIFKKLSDDKFIPVTKLAMPMGASGHATFEHHKIDPVIYPYEWSFCMLKDASLMVLRLLLRLEEEGLTLKDCHPYNILFEGTHPYYVDVCSLVPNNCNSVNPIPIGQFITDYVAPLCMWSSGNEYLARQSLAHIGISPMPMSSWEAYFQGYSSFVLVRFLTRIIAKVRTSSWYLYRNLYKYIFAQNLLDTIASKLPSSYWSLRIIPTEKFIQDLSPPRNKSIWSDYHKRSFQGEPSQRLNTILSMVKRLGVSSAVDLACNEGLFSLMLAKEPSILKVISIDRDGDAIDSLYNSIRTIASSYPDNSSYLSKITPVLSDFLPSGAVRSNPDLTERVRSEGVFALALTHHLLLSQGLKIEIIIERILAFSLKYAFIEFMPMGLWNGFSAPPVPDWYNRGFFEDALSRKSRILSVHNLETNRILFVCEKSNSAPV